MKHPHRALILLVTLPTVVLLGRAGSPAHAVDTSGQGFQSLALSALAGGLQVNADGLTNLPAGSAAASIPVASAQLSRSSSHALASLAWPGALAANVGSLLYLLGPSPCLPGDDPVLHKPVPVVGGTCDEVAPVPQPVLDNYHYLNTPLRAEAQNPSSTHAEQGTSGASMIANAVADKASAESHIGGGTTINGLSFGTISATSEVRATGSSAAASQTVSTVQDLSVAGGVLTISSVMSSAAATTAGTTSTASGGTILSGMAVNGLPITVDGTGVHTVGHDVDTSQATAAITTALASQGLRLYVTSDTRQVRGGIAEYHAGSLVIVWDVDRSGRNDDIVLVIGGADARAAATPSSNFAYLPSVPSVPSLPVGPSATTSEVAAPFLPVGAQLPLALSDDVRPLTAQESLSQSAAHRMGFGRLILNPPLGVGWVLLLLTGALGLSCLGGRLPKQLLSGSSSAECLEGVKSHAG